MIGEPLVKDSRTYYLTGNRVVAVYVRATSIVEDLKFLDANPENQVSGQHYNCQRWILDRDVLVKTRSNPHDPMHMDAYTIIDAEHPISKTIEMYKLVGALPDALDDWSNDGPI